MRAQTLNIPNQQPIWDHITQDFNQELAIDALHAIHRIAI